MPSILLRHHNERSDRPPIETRGSVWAESTGIVGRSVARYLGLPRDGRASARLCVTPRVSNERSSSTRWTRTFGGRSWSTTLTIEDDSSITERLGWLTIRFVADVGHEADADHLRLRLVAIGVNRWALARWLLPAATVDIVTLGQDTITTVDVRFPLGLGRLRYTASMGQNPVNADPTIGEGRDR